MIETLIELDFISAIRLGTTIGVCILCAIVPSVAFFTFMRMVANSGDKEGP